MSKVADAKKAIDAASKARGDAWARWNGASKALVDARNAFYDAEQAYYGAKRARDDAKKEDGR
jgi:hypothetical protein